VIVLEKLQALGKEYPWNCPGYCPKCRSKRLWGHGYVIRYFQGFAEGLYLKRWICPDCGSVHTLRPKTHQARIQYSKHIIRESLIVKLSTMKFSEKWVYRQVQQHWWRNLKRWFASRSLDYSPQEMLDHLETAQHLRIGASLTDKVVDYAGGPTYLPFALNVNPRPG
jgi:hypothetical protein